MPKKYDEVLKHAKPLEWLCRVERSSDLPISFNIAPSQDVLAVRYDPEKAVRSLVSLRWGLIPSWAKDEKIGYRTINARMETVQTRARL